MKYNMEERVKKIKYRLLGTFRGITIVPYIFVFGEPLQGAKWDRFINHERIHFRQVQDEMDEWGTVLGWIVWYFKYIYKWISNIPKCGKRAYRLIDYEQEAYDNQHDETYLDNREPFAYKKYKNGQSS